MLLDTSFSIDLMNGDEDTVEKTRELENDLVQQPVLTRNVEDFERLDVDVETY
ncbi:hypothetical protein [Halorubrum cibi]|uniref:Uncharacterized protein n=1 Tax=Halorubrum cibi TaxID=413815 RepID=A0A521EIT4_9EURY|nr:hypothetical protein [Halorubrum cibi]SMO83806.1 hypothetical protein SAMN06264867_11125 [Halorubrum cibi]